MRACGGVHQLLFPGILYQPLSFDRGLGFVQGNWR